MGIEKEKVKQRNRSGNKHGFRRILLAVILLVALSGSVLFEPLSALLDQDNEYLGETAEFAKLSKILKRGEITEEEETWLFEVARHHPYMSGEPKFARMVKDMLGSLTNRFDLSGTQYWREKTGDLQMINRRTASCPSTQWGYSPTDSADERIKAVQQLVHNNEYVDDSIKADLVRIVVFEDDYRVSAIANCVINAWENKGTLEEMPEYKGFVRAEERRALMRLFDHHGMIKNGILQTGDTNIVLTYDSRNENPDTRRMAVKKFIDYYLVRGVNPALVQMEWEAVSIITMIHYWDDNFSVSKTAGAVLYPFPDITISQAQTEKGFVDKNFYGVPPFPWERLGEYPSYYSSEATENYGYNAPPAGNRLATGQLNQASLKTAGASQIGVFRENIQ